MWVGMGGNDQHAKRRQKGVKEQKESENDRAKEGRAEEGCSIGRTHRLSELSCVCSRPCACRPTLGGGPWSSRVDCRDTGARKSIADQHWRSAPTARRRERRTHCVMDAAIVAATPVRASIGHRVVSHRVASCGMVSWGRQRDEGTHRRAKRDTAAASWTQRALGARRFALGWTCRWYFSICLRRRCQCSWAHARAVGLWTTTRVLRDRKEKGWEYCGRRKSERLGRGSGQRPQAPRGLGLNIPTTSSRQHCSRHEYSFLGPARREGCHIRHRAPRFSAVYPALGPDPPPSPARLTLRRVRPCRALPSPPRHALARFAPLGVRARASTERCLGARALASSAYRPNHREHLQAGAGRRQLASHTRLFGSWML